jgi:hypothetical protein
MNNPSTQTKENTMAESQYREYVDVVRPPDPPRARVGDIELLSQTIAIRVWAFRSKHDLATVLRPDFFDDLRDVHLKRCDRIEVVAFMGCAAGGTCDAVCGSRGQHRQGDL